MWHFEVLLVFAIVWQVSFTQSFQEIRGKYYHIENDEKLDWYDARDKCRSMDAHLVSIQNFVEWDAITDELKHYKSYWVDIKDNNSNNYISDTTGRKAPYLKWSWLQLVAADYDCVKLLSLCHNMITNYCSEENHYICERNTRPAIPEPESIVHRPGKYDIIDLRYGY